DRDRRDRPRDDGRPQPVEAIGPEALAEYLLPRHRRPEPGDDPIEERQPAEGDGQPDELMQDVLVLRHGGQTLSRGCSVARTGQARDMARLRGDYARSRRPPCDETPPRGRAAGSVATTLLPGQRPTLARGPRGGFASSPRRCGRGPCPRRRR